MVELSFESIFFVLLMSGKIFFFIDLTSFLIIGMLMFSIFYYSIVIRCICPGIHLFFLGYKTLGHTIVENNLSYFVYSWTDNCNAFLFLPCFTLLYSLVGLVKCLLILFIFQKTSFLLMTCSIFQVLFQ